MDDSATKLLELLETSGRRVHALLFKLTSRADVAEELLQELFVRLLRSPAFSKASNPEAYLVRSAIHLAFDWRKLNQQDCRYTESYVESQHPMVAPLDALINAETVQNILRCLELLSEIEKSAVQRNDLNSLHFSLQLIIQSVAACA